MRTMTELNSLLASIALSTPIGRPVFQPRRKKLKGWQKEMRRNSPKRFFKGKKK